MQLDRTIAMISLLLSASATGCADAIFNDLGPGNSYADTNYGVSSYQTVAGAFTPTANYTLSQIDLGITLYAGTNSVNVSVRNDSDGAPGSQIESWNLTNLPAYGSLNAFETVTAVATDYVFKGTEYWVEVSPGDSTTIAAWMQNDQNVLGSVYFTQFSTVPDVLSAFDVLGTPTSPVPEAGCFLPIAASLLALLVRRKRFWS